MTIGLLTAVVFTPLIGALVIGFSPARWARILALVTALITWVISLWVAIQFSGNVADIAGRPGGVIHDFQMVEV